MAWKDFLAASMRLVDLYDANRDFGAAGAASVLPGRAKKVDEERAGVLFDLGTAILEMLDVYEEESPGTYVLASEVYTSLRDDFPACTPEDFYFVLNKLSLRYPLFFSRENVLLKDTVLVERARAGERIRLSAKGRMALSLSEAAEDWLYSDLNAEKIIRAITRGDFGQVFKYTLSLAQAIKEASVSVIRMIELPSAELKSQALYTDNQLYSGTVSKIQSIVLEAARNMESSEVTSRVEMWIEAHPDDLDIDIKIRDKFSVILSTIEALSRNLSEVINAAEKSGLDGVRALPFNEAARFFAIEEKIDIAEEVLLRAGFWCMPKSFGSVTDVLVPIIVKNHVPKSRASFTNAGKVVEEFVREFVRIHGEDFLERIRENPLSLSDIFEKGLLGGANEQMLGEVIGVFVDAKAVGFKSGHFRVRLGSSQCIRDDFDVMYSMGELFLEFSEV